MFPEQGEVVCHFESNLYRASNGRFIVPLPKKKDLPNLGESKIAGSQEVSQLVMVTVFTEIVHRICCHYVRILRFRTCRGSFCH